MSSPALLLIDDDENVRATLKSLLEDCGYDDVRATGGVAEAERAIDARAPDIALIDMRLGDGSGLDVLKHLRQAAPGALGIVVTGNGSYRIAVDALRAGAFDFVEKPALAERLMPVLDRALQHLKPRRAAARAGASADFADLGQTPLLGSSEAMQDVITKIGQVALSPSTTALILGESGTGKELVARAIHHGGSRRKARFVAVNCAAISESLLEAELFGYEKGSFTGAAATGKIGLFEAAHKGTVFLDEIGEMPLGMQAKLLRVLQERVIRRVGAIDDVAVDVRVVASTNRDLAKEVKDGRFRLDLYFRLKVMPIQMPALRDRREDIPVLAEFFLAELAREFGKDLRGLSAPAREALMRYAFPGNVRELRNVIEHAVIVAEGPVVEHGDLLLEAEPIGPAPAAPAAPSGGIVLTLADARVETAEREVILWAIRESRGNRTKAAERLGLNRSTLAGKLRSYGVPEGEWEPQPAPAAEATGGEARAAEHGA